MVDDTIISAATALAGKSAEATAKAGIAGQIKEFAGPIAITFVLPLLLIIVILIFVIRNVSPTIQFLYANARIHARSNLMITHKKANELIDSKSLKEFKSLLRETIYGEDIERSEDTLKSVHHSLERGYINSIYELVEMSPEKSKPLINSYIRFLEVKILKIIYRAKLNKVPLEEDFVYPIGTIDKILLKHLMGTETVQDMTVVMANTPYSDVFEKKYANLEEFENAIDNYAYSEFVKIIEKTKIHDGRQIMEILNRKIDISNILALIKLRVREVEKEKQRGLLIDNHSQISQRFDKLINTESMKEFTEQLKGTAYHEPMAKSLEKYDKDSSLSHFENNLNKLFKEIVEDYEMAHTLGPYPLFSYLVKRELELRNLNIISRGIDCGFSTDKMKEMVS